MQFKLCLRCSFSVCVRVSLTRVHSAATPDLMAKQMDGDAYGGADAGAYSEADGDADGDADGGADGELRSRW